jgi:Putative beta-barrel porin-2, OmpL-like. bbp2
MESVTLSLINPAALPALRIAATFFLTVNTGHGAHYGEIAVGLNVMPTPWINFRPEIRGDFASEPSFGSVRSTNRERSQFTVPFDIILKFH